MRIIEELYLRLLLPDLNDQLINHKIKNITKNARIGFEKISTGSL